MSPKISVIINTYNRAHYLHQSIKSVLDQTFKDFELIIWDDGSEDNTSNIVSNFNDERIVYIKNNHIGQYKSRNKAMQIAKGEYISFLDSDDYFLKNKLELQYKTLFNSDYEVCLSNYFILNQSNGKKKRAYFFSKKEGNILNQITKKYEHNCLSTLFFKKKLILSNTINFIEKYKIISDKDFILKLAKFSKIRRITKPLSFYRIHDNNVSIKNKVLEIQELEDWVNDIKNKKFDNIFSNKQINNLFDRVYYLKITNFISIKNTKNFFNYLKQINSVKLRARGLIVAILKLIKNKIFYD
jgi:glycosyltransferase involved in cell wall biosynthesis